MLFPEFEPRLEGNKDARDYLAKLDGLDLGGLKIKITGRLAREQFADFYYQESKLEIPPRSEVLLQFFFEKATTEALQQKSIFISKEQFKMLPMFYVNEILTDGWIDSLRGFISKIRRSFEEVGASHQISSKNGGYVLTWK